MRSTAQGSYSLDRHVCVIYLRRYLTALIPCTGALVTMGETSTGQQGGHRRHYRSDADVDHKLILVSSLSG